MASGRITKRSINALIANRSQGFLWDDGISGFGAKITKAGSVSYKPPFGQLEMGVYSGANEESSPQAFHIEKTESGKDGSSRVNVRSSFAKPYDLVWHVAVIVVRENDRTVVDDVIYLRDQNQPDEYRLSQLLGDGCRGPRYVG